MSEPTSKVDQAAIVLLNLPRREACSLVARIEPDQALQLEQAISRGQCVSESEQRAILREFTGQGERVSGQGDFEFLRGLDPEVLAPFLLDELPQTIAVVLVHAPHESATGVLRQLPREKQIEVSRRLASASLLDAQLAGDIAHELRRQMADVLRLPRHDRRDAAHQVMVGDVMRLLSRAKAG